MTADRRAGAEWRRVRRLAPGVLGALVRRYGHFDVCEDAVQEALLAAARQWPAEGWPENPRAWLVTVASRRLADQLRSDEARRRRETEDRLRTPEPSGTDWAVSDDTLTLLFLCCHPALSPASQLALTLRAVAGLTTAEVARAFLVPEATMAQRISRAKERIRAAGATFDPPREHERGERLTVVQRVLYLVFNEGYTATAGTNLVRDELTSEAIRLARMLHRLVPDDGESAGLLALMLLIDARRTARTGSDGSLVPLAEQDRSLWDHDLIAEGVDIITSALRSKPVGPYQVQAAIAAVHDEAASADTTDWPQILALYGVLERLDPSPVVSLNRAVALAMVEGPAAGLALVGTLADTTALTRSHHLDSVRGHLLEMAGDPVAAGAAYRAAAKRATSVPEQRHLLARAARLRVPAQR